jgi:hypothetical protein
MKLDNKVYDILKWVALVVLPAVATLYTALAGVWGLPFAEEIPATITAIDLFIGALLGVSTAQYNKEDK